MSRDTAHTAEKGADYEKLGEDWPALNRRLVAALRRRGIPAADAEDAVQTAFERAFARRVPFKTAEDLYPWLYTVAWRQALNGVRVRSRELEEAADKVSPIDTHDEVEARCRLRAVEAAFANLKPGDQQAILSFVEGSAEAEVSDRRDAVRVAVRRHRARARLDAMSQRFAGVVLATRVRLRWLSSDANVAAAPLFFASALGAALVLGAADLPGGSQRQPTEGRVAARPGEAGPTPPVASPADLGAGGASRRGTPPTRGAPPPPGRVSVPIPHAGPLGGSVEGRPKTDDDHLVCVDTVAAGRPCFDPVRIDIRAIVDQLRSP